MAKTKISEYSATSADNTDISNINIAEGCSPANVNNAIRTVMAQLKDQQAGTSGDNFTVGGNLTVTGTSTLTGNVTAPTQSSSDNSTKVATTAFVTTKVGTLGTMASQNATAVAITGGTITGITDLTVADGGTGASSITANSVILGNGTSTLSGNLVAPSTSGNVLTSNGTTWASAAPSGGLGVSQSWSATAKVAGTTYTNSSSKPIMVLYNVTSTGSSTLTVIVNGVTILTTNAAGNSSFISFIVPPSHTYRVDATNIGSQTFAELA
jgi:hypothetical protein